MADEGSEGTALLQRILHEVVSGRDLLERRIDSVQERVETLRDQTHSNFDGTFQRLERIEIESTSISAALARVEQSTPNRPDETSSGRS
jgi:hypothetical protein